VWLAGFFGDTLKSKLKLQKKRQNINQSINDTDPGEECFIDYR
jgi:hypothetical protein